MNKLIISSILLLSLTAPLYSQSKVKDKRKIEQYDRRVFKRSWDEPFKPGWLFLLFLKKYKNGPDKRNILQLAPMKAFAKQTLTHAENEKANIDTVYNQQLADAFFRTAKPFYHLRYKGKLETINEEIDYVIFNMKNVGVEKKYIDVFLDEQDRINQHITIINKAYLTNGQNSEGLETIIQELEEFIITLKEFSNFYSVINL